MAELTAGPYTGRQFDRCAKCGDFGLIFRKDEAEPTREKFLEDCRGILKYLNLDCHRCGHPIILREIPEGRGKGLVVGCCTECGEYALRPEKGEEPLPLDEQILILNSPPFKDEPMSPEALDEMTVGSGDAELPLREYLRRQVN
jgi:hypothetical protein